MDEAHLQFTCRERVLRAQQSFTSCSGPELLAGTSNRSICNQSGDGWRAKLRHTAFAFPDSSASLLSDESPVGKSRQSVLATMFWIHRDESSLTAFDGPSMVRFSHPPCAQSSVVD